MSRPSLPSVGWRNGCPGQGHRLATAGPAGKHHRRSDPGHTESRCATLASTSEMSLRHVRRRDARKVCHSFAFRSTSVIHIWLQEFVDKKASPCSPCLRGAIFFLTNFQHGDTNPTESTRRDSIFFRQTPELGCE